MSRCGPCCPHMRLHTELFFNHHINMETPLGRVPINKMREFPRIPHTLQTVCANV